MLYEQRLSPEEIRGLEIAGRQMLGPFLHMIRNLSIWSFTQQALGRAPTYFWIRPSSTSGGYHPADEFVPGGLVVHTVKVCVLMQEFFRQPGVFSGEQQDILMSAAILHDLLSSGFPGRELREESTGFLRTDPLHMLYVREYLKGLKFETLDGDGTDRGAPKERIAGTMPWFNDLMICIEGHYGPWSPVPQVRLDDEFVGWSGGAREWRNWVYLADYVASRGSVQVFLG
jgi:hypothetical protein